jgi:hypothetical protein
MIDLYSLDEALDYLNGTNCCTIENLLEAINIESNQFDKFVKNIETLDEVTYIEESVGEKVKGIFKKILEALDNLIEMIAKAIRFIGGKAKEIINKLRKKTNNSNLKDVEIDGTYKTFKLAISGDSGNIPLISNTKPASAISFDNIIDNMEEKMLKITDIAKNNKDNDESLKKIRDIAPSFQTYILEESEPIKITSAKEAIAYSEEIFNILKHNNEYINKVAKNEQINIKKIKFDGEKDNWKDYPVITEIGRYKQKYITFLNNLFKLNIQMEEELVKTENDIEQQLRKMREK